MENRPFFDVRPEAKQNTERQTPVFNNLIGGEMDENQPADRTIGRNPELACQENRTAEDKCGNVDLPLVSIITPAYNRAGFLDETIQSVLSQDYPNIEYIILDDGSTDNTPRCFKKVLRSDLLGDSHKHGGNENSKQGIWNGQGRNCMCCQLG